MDDLGGKPIIFGNIHIIGWFEKEPKNLSEATHVSLPVANRFYLYIPGGCLGFLNHQQ